MGSVVAFKHRMAVLAFIVGTAYLPVVPTAGFLPRWWALALGLAICSPLDPRRLDPRVLFCMIGMLALAASSLII